MNKSLEDLILSEIEKHHPKALNDKMAYFSQLCEKLGLPKERLNEITPRVEKLFREQLNNERIH